MTGTHRLSNTEGMTVGRSRIDFRKLTLTEEAGK